MLDFIMFNEPRKFMTVSEIDATGIKGPHEKELEDISIAKHALFMNLEKEKLKELVEEFIGGKLESIGFSEDWAITLEMFPEVNIHMAYSYFGDEFGDGIEAEFKFYFSGKRVFLVPGEDSATYIVIVMDFIERKLKNKAPFETNYDLKTDLMKKVLLQRNGPFVFLKENDKNDLAEFMGAEVSIVNDTWSIKKEVFPKIIIEILWNELDGLDIKFTGNLNQNIGSYHIEFIGIFVINHILRFITLNNLDKDLPDICHIMFSRYYTKLQDWDHKTR